MVNSRVPVKFWAIMGMAALLGVAGCSSQPTQETNNTPPPPAKKAAPPKPAPAAAAPAPVAKKEAQPKPMVTVPKGTAISATLGQTLTSKKSKAGDSFAATLTAPVALNGATVLPKGAKLSGKLVAIRKHDIKVALASVSLHGQSYALETNSVAGPAKAQVKNAASKGNEDVIVLAAKTPLTFKLAKAASLPAPPVAKAKKKPATKAAKTASVAKKSSS